MSARSTTQNVRPPDNRRTIPVRLVDIEVDRRVRAARQAARFEVDSLAKWDLFFAAWFPSDTVYFVAA